MSSITKSAAPPPSTLPVDDGTPISYYLLGSNAASKIIIVPGAMSSALSQFELGTALSATHTVYLLSRRTRGLSGPYPAYISTDGSIRSKSPLATTDAPTIYDPEFSSQVLTTDLQDLAALMRHTGATNLMGISSGGLLVLAALLTFNSDSALKVTMPPITKAIIFDPPLFFSTPITATTNTTTTSTYSQILPLLRRYEHEMSSGATVDALLTAMRVAQMGPAWLAHIPRWILRPLTRKMLAWEVESQARKIAAAAAATAAVPDASDEKQHEEGAVTMQALAPVLRYDFALCEAISLLLSGESGSQRLADLSTAQGRGEVLFLGGELSPGYVKGALDVLADVMMITTGRGTGRESPDQRERGVGGVKRVEILGVGHELFENEVRNGKVGRGVGVVEAFLEKGVVWVGSDG